MIPRIFAVLAAVLVSVTAFANEGDKARGAETFKAMDANRDDRLTQNEVSGDATLAQHFAALDRNSDGYLTKQEYAAHMKGDKDKDRRQY